MNRRSSRFTDRPPALRRRRMHEFRSLLGGSALAILVFVAPACLASSSNLYPSSKKEARALKLAQVTGIANRAQIQALGKDLQRLHDSGIPDSALVDGSVAQGRVYCCGGLPASTGLDALWFYVPPDVELHPGDIAEIRLGQEPDKRSPGQVNVLTRVRERADASEHHCHWDPEKPGAWMRVIYCDWMSDEGWTHKKGIGNPWIKAAAPDSTP